jgi:hypothetical protein
MEVEGGVANAGKRLACDDGQSAARVCSRKRKCVACVTFWRGAREVEEPSPSTDRVSRNVEGRPSAKGLAEAQLDLLPNSGSHHQRRVVEIAMGKLVGINLANRGTDQD